MKKLPSQFFKGFTVFAYVGSTSFPSFLLILAVWVVDEVDFLYDSIVIMPEMVAALREKTFFMRKESELEGVTLLGCQGVAYPTDYAPQLLETFENKHPENEYVVTFDCPEFTTLCPKTGQPDFGHIIISYIPRERMVESKSLKLYLFSFRNHGDFHEDCVNIIMKDLWKLMDPKYIEVKGLFMPRGGISIYPFANMGDADHQDLCKARRVAALDMKK